MWEIFAGRITFVERDRDGHLIHVAGRAFARESRAKYLFLPDLPKPVYGLGRARPSRPTFVVEGIVDRITLWQWGYQAVAMLGTSVKTPDARRLARGQDIYYVTDNNPAGLIAVARWREAGRDPGFGGLDAELVPDAVRRRGAGAQQWKDGEPQERAAGNHRRPSSERPGARSPAARKGTRMDRTVSGSGVIPGPAT